MDALIKLWLSEDVPHAAKTVFTVLWLAMGHEPGVLEKMSMHRLAMMCRLSEGQARDRLKSLERCGLVERAEETTRGEFTLYVFMPFAPKVERPKKIKPTPLFDSLESSSEIPSEKQWENPREIPTVLQREKPDIPASFMNDFLAEIGKKPEATGNSPRPETAPTREAPQNTASPPPSFMNDFLAEIGKKPEAAGNSPRTVPAKPPEKMSLPMQAAQKIPKPHYISIDSIDNKYLNSIESIDILLKKHQNLYVQAVKLAPEKEQAYLPIMVVLMAAEGVLKADRWREIQSWSKEGNNPGACLQTNLTRVFGKNNLDRFRRQAKDYYMETSRKLYKRQLAGVR